MGRSLWGAAILLLAWALGGAACGAWAFAGDSSPLQTGIAVLAPSVAGACAAVGWWRQPVGVLAWDGAVWTWSPERGTQPSPGALEPAMDLQSAMLLRWHGETTGSRWFWAERQSDPGRWAALRRAVYSRARSDAPARAEPPTAAP